MQSQGLLARSIEGFFGLCLPLALFFFGVAWMSSADLSRLKELDGQLRVARGRLLSTEVRFTPTRRSGQKGFWCAFGKFVINEVEPPLEPGGTAEGAIGRYSPGDLGGRSSPHYAQEEAEADAQKWTIGDECQGWIYFDQPDYILFKRPYEQVQTQVTYLYAIGGGLLGLFVLRVIVGLLLRTTPTNNDQATTSHP